MTFIGLDLSLTASGVVVVDQNGNTLDRILIKPKTKGGERLDDICYALTEAILKHRPLDVAVESPFSAPSPAVLAVCMQLAELHGAFKLAMYRENIPRPWYVAPGTLKKYATGSGKGQKSDVKMAILKKWGMEFKDDNEADAYVLARIAMSMHKGAPLEYETECIKTIVKSPVNELRTKGPEGSVLVHP